MKYDIFVTGGTGFIGGALTHYLLQQGHKVGVLVRKNSPNAEKLKGTKAILIEGDICKLESLIPAVKGVKKVFHCAAIASDWGSRRLFDQVNVLGTKNILEASLQANIERFIAISTNDVFGVVEDKVIEESMPFQKWNEPYPDTKILAEEYVWEYHRKHGLPATSVYPCWVYGINDTSFLPHVVEALEKKEMLFWRKGSLMWPTYIENLIDLLCLISEDERAVGNGYLIHDGISFTFEEFCNMLTKELGFKEAHTHIPYSLAYITAFFLESIWKVLQIKKRPLLTTYVIKNLGSKLKFSIDKANRELGWKPKISFEEGFSKTIKWLKEGKYSK